MKKRTKKTLLFWLLIGVVITLVGCEKPSFYYIENPYFEDASKNEIIEMYEQKAIYDDKLVAYYNDTYAHPANVQFREYQYLPGYEILPDTEMLDVETLKINHDIIDQRELFQYSQMAYFLDNDALWYML